MKPTIHEVSNVIESIMSKGKTEENLELVSQYLKDNCFEVNDDDDFLDSLLHEKNFFSLEERLSYYVVDFMGDGTEDRNEGLAYKDVV